MIYPPFTLVDAELILSESEGRANAGANSGHGHAGERHVKIINGDLMHRMTFGSAPNSGIPIYTAFVTFAEQVRAFHEALTSDAFALPLNTFNGRAASSTAITAGPSRSRSAWRPAEA